MAQAVNNPRIAYDVIKPLLQYQEQEELFMICLTRTSEIKDILENMTTAAPEMEDYIGEDGLLYCGKCHTPKEA